MNKIIKAIEDIKNGKIAVAYTSYNDQNVYSSVSNIENMDFSNYTNVNSGTDSFQNYPYILLDDVMHIVWVDFNGYDVFYGMRDLNEDEIINVQKINNDDSNLLQKDPIIYKSDDMLYSFWSDQRHGNYEIYFSKGINESILTGDINQDNIIDILDVVLIINFILGQENPDTIEAIASDLNSDGTINIQDVILLINMILN